MFEKYDISNIFLITPETEEKRIREIDSITDSFIYVVSSASTTGINNKNTETQNTYFKKIKHMNLKSPLLIGFGINDKTDFSKACSIANGAIIGSEFIKQLNSENIDNNIGEFVKNIIL